MATARLRQIRRRIRSVQSTRKITRAMELIAASRIMRAQARVESARPYVQRLTEVIQDLAAHTGGASQSSLLTEREVKTHGLVVITADRGLAGAYSSNVLRLAEGALRREGQSRENTRLYVAGRKGSTYLRYRGYEIAHELTGTSDNPSFDRVKAMAEAVTDDFLEGEIDVVTVLYTEFYSLVTQRAEEFQLLPVPPAELGGGAGFKGEFIFEPGPEEILDHLLPRYVEGRLFAAFLESSASEHAARRRAMKAATDNADDLLKTLSRNANQERQTEITTEILEVVGGAEALREAEEAG